MIKRIVEINNPAKLTIKNKQMVISQDETEKAIIPIEDLGILILDHPAITQSTGLLSACLDNNVAVVTCDKKHLPNSIFLSLDGNSLQTKVISKQIQITEPTRKRLWQAIIKAKISEQAKVLDQVIGEDHSLSSLVPKVKSGDHQNVESLAARIYWQKLFGERFKRERDQPGINGCLNYGYAVMRASVARAIVGTGLHPSIGIHHHNKYNNLCLADDLIEPLRPIVDLNVIRITQDLDVDYLTPDIKKRLLDVLSWNLTIGKNRFPLLIALHHYTASLRKVICNESKGLEIPYL